jgi:dienelactone hydrolase
LNIIFVADIFGLTEEFKHLCQQVVLKLEASTGIKCRSHLLGPYQQQPALFASENDAYQYFMANVTLAGYVKKLEKIGSQLQLQQQTQLNESNDTFLVGFSVGGSAIWQFLSQYECLQSVPSKDIASQGTYSQGKFAKNLAAIGFYSSQIRHMTALTPKVSMRLIFPVAEQHFCVTELQTQLQGKPTVTIEASPYLHGFMNELSMNYDSEGCQHYIQRLVDLLLMQSSQPISQVND